MIQQCGVCCPNYSPALLSSIITTFSTTRSWKLIVVEFGGYLGRAGVVRLNCRLGERIEMMFLSMSLVPVLMIIKGLFRRYERWNPVHPTSGAFWGMGIGVGCGIGWGPGFGPDVIGYVGAGCGVGFSVGITLAGVGIVDFARSSGLLGTRRPVDISGMQRWMTTFNHEQSVDKRVDFSGINRLMSSNAKLVLEYFDQLKNRR
ncbi:hypothetical protein Ccrd_006369 [Cynara cardunculus var. scolymus]|uniref:Cadmium-induced protein AS8 n=1 Tax=Cynara cardunculus var. scolymus TaxID=59895 RepID=A0A124SBT1_CYNCS|nr:hypothetical protein Ccrd_006369 [Cynara cardunculus var. scolymus]